MKKYLYLVKLLFIQQYRIKPQQGKRKKSGTIVAFVVLGLCFLPMLISLASGMFFLGRASRGLDNVASITTTLILLCQGIVLVFGIPSLMTNVFSSKDADKLLFLPVRSATIFSAKLTVVYLNEVITTVVTILATMLPFGIGLSAGAGYFVLLIPAFLLVPLLPMLLGSIIAMPLSALIAKFSKNGVVKTLLQILLFAIILVGYLFIMYELGMLGGGLGDADEVTGEADIAKVLLDKLQNMGQYAKYVHSNYTLAAAMTSAAFGAVILNLLISLGENILLFGIVLLTSLPFYHWILSTSVEGEGGGRRKRSGKSAELQVKNQGILKELIFTDIKRVIRDGQMGFQCVMSLIILPLMVVMFYFIFSMGDSEDSILSLRTEPLYQVIAPIAFLAYMSMLGMTSNVLGIYPISRENNAIYIIKSLPVSFNKYLLAKVVLATSAMLISDTVMCVLIVALFGVQWYYGLLLLLTMALMGFGAMCVTTLIDLKSPKIGWTNFNQSLKNAKNSWLAMLVGFICLIVVGTIAGLCITGYALLSNAWYMLLIMWTLIIGLAATFAAVSYRVMTGRAQTYFDSIEP